MSLNNTVNSLLQDTDTTVALSQNSSVAQLDRISGFDITAVIADATASDKTFDTGTMEVQTLTFPAVADATAGDYVVLTDGAGLTWAISLDKTGADPEPTGALWVAVNAARKVHVNISGGTDAASVAALVETAFDALTGATAAIVTDDTAADGTMTLTMTIPGPVANPVPKNADDSGAGSITGVQTTGGVAGEVSPSANTVTIPSHGYFTGLKITELTTTGTLPAGLSASTIYYVIVVDSDTIKFATSQANALAGTAVDITGYGTSTAVHTLDIAATIAGTIKLQKTNDPASVASPTWVDLVDAEVTTVTASQSISAASTKNWNVRNFNARAIRVVTTITSGAVTAAIRIHGKNT